MSECSHPAWATGPFILTTAMQYEEYEDFPGDDSAGDILVEFCVECGALRIPPDALEASRKLRSYHVKEG